jgi:CRP-like cAMP-binding protein
LELAIAGPTEIKMTFMATALRQTGNRILDRLPADERNSLLARSKVVALRASAVVYSQDGPMTHAYFPATSVFGVVLVVEGGKQVEGTTVGNEGMVGLPLFLGADFHPFMAISQIPGDAVQVPAATFLHMVKESREFDRLLRLYTLYRLRYAKQTGACNSVHSVEERLCRWLLMAHDRAGQEEFLLTHEFMAELLGVRRQTVTIVAGTLQRAGLITYRRGVLKVLDREALEAASCECYASLKNMYARIMGV